MASEFPLPFTVGHRAYAGAGEDAHGNANPDYAAAVDIAAFWYSVGSSEPAVAGHDRVTVDLVVVVDSEQQINPLDLLVIEDQDYDVVGYPEDYDHGPFDWAPGCKPVNVRRVDG